MANEFPIIQGQRFIGLLTHEQKQQGYFVCQDEDFIYLWHRENGNPRNVAIFLYEVATVKEIRDKSTEDWQEKLVKYLSKGLTDYKLYVKIEP